jgi:hypothetical protein
MCEPVPRQDALLQGPGVCREGKAGGNGVIGVNQDETWSPALVAGAASRVAL